MPDASVKRESPQLEKIVCPEGSPVSETAYNEDFEDSSSEATSVIPKTPDLLKRVRERGKPPGQRSERR